MKPDPDEMIAALKQDLADAEAEIKRLGEELHELRAALRAHNPKQIPLAAEGSFEA